MITSQYRAEVDMRAWSTLPKDYEVVKMRYNNVREFFEITYRGIITNGEGDELWVIC